MPLYQGGAEYAAIRQAKETHGQRQLDLNVARDQARVTVVQAWALLEAAKSSDRVDTEPGEGGGSGAERRARGSPARPAHHARRAQRPAGTGQRAHRPGQAQRDRLVNSYGLLAAVGRLSPQVLGLRVPTYDPAVHYHQVRDAWTGVRTPDGR